MPFKQVLKHRCIGCGVCVNSCPVDVLRIGSDGKAEAWHPEDCMTCFMCIEDCPMEAIEIVVFKNRRTPFPPARFLDST